jgi:hypothetical protein
MQRSELTPRKSSLLPFIDLFLCSKCISEKKEPRYVVILAGRQQGISYVSEYLKNHRYEGEVITAKEFV